jgi:SSS family solute:Na+ symporter
MERIRRALLLNGLARFPLTFMYLMLGLVLAALVATRPDLASQIPPQRLDALVPAFVASHLPEGVRALLIAALLSASMSSLDSALNALSAAPARDFLETPQRPLSIRENRLVTFGWGLLITAFAFMVGNIADTVVEAINKIGSAFYGPVLAAFTAGILLPRVNASGIKLGVAAGVLLNLLLWLCLPDLSWMWWNAFGFAAAVIVALLTAGSATSRAGDVSAVIELRRQWHDARAMALLLLTWFALIVIISAAVPRWLGPV